MGKKLTLILLVFVLLIGKSKAAILTQVIDDNYTSMAVKTNQQVKLSFNEKQNYNFTHWSVESGDLELTNPSSLTITFLMPSGDVTIRGNYTKGAPIQRYIITYDANGGTGTMNSQTVNVGESTVLMSNTFTRSGYEFKGWATSSGATTAQYGVGISVTPTSDMTLYAVWQKIMNTVTITYNANGGTGTMNSQIVNVGESAILMSNTFTRSGYEFDGWATSSSATTAQYGAGSSVTPTSDMTLYAIWKKTANTITLTYDANGGSGAPASQNYAGTDGSTHFNVSTQSPTPPAGKAFRGWELRGYGSMKYKPGARIGITRDETLDAIYVTPLPSGSLISNADVGAYVTYQPSSGSYTVGADKTGYSSQSFSPSSTTRWRVLKNGTNVELISDESVGSLMLKGATGYANLVQILQDISAAYVNSTYAQSARSWGYSESGISDLENYKKIDIEKYPLNMGVTGVPYEDDQSHSDYSIIGHSLLRHASGSVWLASRAAHYNDGSGFDFCGRYYTTTYEPNGMGSNKALYQVNYNKTTSDLTDTAGVRPIVKLKSTVKINGGDGSPNNPYTLTY